MVESYDVLELSNEVIRIANINNWLITQLQLQKILYYIQGNFIKTFNKKAFDNQILCWGYGPVVKEVWYEYSYMGKTPLTAGKTRIELKPQEREVITRVVKKCLAMNVWDLVYKTHSEEPWRKAKEKDSEIISDADMESFFSND